MHKSSMLFLLMITVMALTGVYETIFPLDTPLAFARFLGLDAFMLLCVSLLIGPLAVIDSKRFVSLVEPRRSIGLAAFVLTIGHIILAASYDYGFNFGIMLTQVPLIISAIATLILTIIALTSCDYAMKKIGLGLWKNVQRLNYLVFILSFAHFVLEIKGSSAAFGLAGANLTEIAMILLGIATIALQVWGFIIIKDKKGMAKEKMAAADK